MHRRSLRSKHSALTLPTLQKDGPISRTKVRLFNMTLPSRVSPSLPASILARQSRQTHPCSPRFIVHQLVSATRPGLDPSVRRSKDQGSPSQPTNHQPVIHRALQEELDLRSHKRKERGQHLRTNTLDFHATRTAPLRWRSSIPTHPVRGDKREQHRRPSFKPYASHPPKHTTSLPSTAAVTDPLRLD